MRGRGWATARAMIAQPYGPPGSLYCGPPYQILSPTAVPPVVFQNYAILANKFRSDPLSEMWSASVHFNSLELDRCCFWDSHIKCEFLS